MNLIEIMDFDISNILSFTTDECITFCRDVMKSFVTRSGCEELFAFIEKSDFYTAPASTRFHSCYPSGLMRHSLIVMLCLLKKRKNPVWGNLLKEYSDETLVLVSLFHDLCKTYFYSPIFKNVKVYKENGSKQDAGGRFDWESQQGYEVNDKYPLGHGEKSCYFLTKFIDLNISEYSAIRWHMGYSLPKDDYITLDSAMNSNPLLLALYEADLEASHLYEK